MSETPNLPPPRRLLHSIGAVLAGFLAIVVLSTATDQVLHGLRFYPPLGQAMTDPVQNLVALAYRCAFGVYGGWLTARLSPHKPMAHALVLGVIGFALGTLGAVVTLPMHLGPAWYPILLAVSGLPTCWLGGRLMRRVSGAQAG